MMKIFPSYHIDVVFREFFLVVEFEKYLIYIRHDNEKIQICFWQR